MEWKNEEYWKPFSDTSYWNLDSVIIKRSVYAVVKSTCSIADWGEGGNEWEKTE